MDLDRIVKLIPPVIADLKKEYTFTNDAIKDGIFNILEKHCIVVYYPLSDEDTRGFHVKRFVKDRREDFVYINTAKPISEQIFAAAHELGHVWDVVGKILEGIPEETLSTDEEETVINRFAAELLMPYEMFRRTFLFHARDLNVNQRAVKLEDLIKIAVMQMNDYMVPYEAVRRRLVETKIISAKDGVILENNRKTITEVVNLFAKDQNTMLDRVTEKKTIPGLRSMIEQIEKDHLLDDYSLCRIKRDFDMDDVSGALDEYINIEIGDQTDGK